ncbi:MAG: site-specific integrase [Syntrophaceae bacterium]|nr:site-specific integrase [Syntrophaceae bacterium]
MAAKKIGMTDAVKEFGIYLEVERNLSYHTRRSYLADLAQFREFLLAHGVDSPCDVDQGAIRTFLASLYRGKSKKATISRKWRASGRFSRFSFGRERSDIIPLRWCRRRRGMHIFLPS